MHRASVLVTDCKICRGTGWVCVDHPDQPAFECEICHGEVEGMACECNPNAEMPPGFQTLASVAHRYVLRSQNR